jgi:DNA helicase-4
MDERIRERLHTDDITARTFHALALYIIQQGGKKRRKLANLRAIPARDKRYCLKPGKPSAQRKSAGQRLATVAGRGAAVAGSGRQLLGR